MILNLCDGNAGMGTNSNNRMGSNVDKNFAGIGTIPNSNIVHHNSMAMNKNSMNGNVMTNNINGFGNQMMDGVDTNSNTMASSNERSQESMNEMNNLGGTNNFRNNDMMVDSTSMKGKKMPVRNNIISDGKASISSTRNGDIHKVDSNNMINAYTNDNIGYENDVNKNIANTNMIHDYSTDIKSNFNSALGIELEKPTGKVTNTEESSEEELTETELTNEIVTIETELQDANDLATGNLEESEDTSNSLSNFKDNWDGVERTDMPMFLHIPKSGGSLIKDIMGACHRFVMVTEMGVTDGHGEDEVSLR